MGFPKTQGISTINAKEIKSEPSGTYQTSPKITGSTLGGLIAPGLFLGSKKDGMRRCLKSQHVWTRLTSS